MHPRVAVLGNAGSGKSYFAAAIAKAWSLPPIDLDTVFWMPGGYTEKRPAHAVHYEIAKRKAEERWVFEGVYGELIALVLDRATFLAWLDVDWPTCLASLMARRHSTPEEFRAQTNDSFKALIDYAGAYWTRDGLRSQRGHHSMFDQFPHAKMCFHSRDEVTAFLQTL